MVLPYPWHIGIDASCLNLIWEIIFSPYPWHIGEQRLSSASPPCAQLAEPKPRQARRQSENPDFYHHYFHICCCLVPNLCTKFTWKMKHDITQTSQAPVWECRLLPSLLSHLLLFGAQNCHPAWNFKNESAFTKVCCDKIQQNSD